MAFCKKRRNIVAFLAFFGFFHSYALRTNLSVAVVAMTTNRTTTMGNIIINEGPEFNWTSKTRGYVLSSFFYGYVTTQIIGGWLSIKTGGQKLFGIGIGMMAFLTLLTPWSSRISVHLLIALRIAEGFFSGVTMPCMSAVLSKWVPPIERTKLATMAMSGCPIGTVVAMTATSYFVETIGWSGTFYVFGGTSIIWFIIWMYFVSETPSDDSRISSNELEYILRSLGSLEIQQVEYPWKEIFTSFPVWSIIIYSFADDWVATTIMTQLPSYLKDVFDYDLQSIGFLCAIPYVATPIVGVFSGQMMDWLRKKQILTTTQVRKIFTCGSSIAQATILLALSYSSSVTTTIFCVILLNAFGACGYAGFGVNNLDIAPQYAGLIMGISNTAGSLAGVCSPILVGYVVTITSSEQWRIVFSVASGIILFGGVVYGVFASGEIQIWDVKTKYAQSSSYYLLTDCEDDSQNSTLFK